jgi:hypothetical protein
MWFNYFYEACIIITTKIFLLKYFYQNTFMILLILVKYYIYLSVK